MIVTDNETRSGLGVVVIIDDDPGVRKSIQFLLEVAGYAVRNYTSAVAFLSDRNTMLNDINCFIFDQQMPQMTGLELAAQLRAEGVDVPVLLFTAQPSPIISVRAAEVRIEVLPKPAAHDELLKFVALACDPRRTQE